MPFPISISKTEDLKPTILRLIEPAISDLNSLKKMTSDLVIRAQTTTEKILKTQEEQLKLSNQNSLLDIELQEQDLITQTLNEENTILNEVLSLQINPQEILGQSSEYN